MAAAVTTDEIYKRYLDKAIKEILRLEHEVAEAAAGAPVAQPTGHPLGTIFLLKYGPQAPGAAGGRRLPRPRRARAQAVARAAARRPARGVRHELRQVRRAPTRTSAAPGSRASSGSCSRGSLVVMGDDALEFVNELEFPLSPPLDGYAGRAAAASPRRSRRWSSPTSTSPSTSSPRRHAFGTRSSPSAPGGPRCRPTSTRRSRRSSRWYELAAAPVESALGWPSVAGCVVVSLADAGDVRPDRWLALPACAAACARRRPARSRLPRRRRSLLGVLDAAGLGELRQVRRGDARSAGCSSRFFEALSWVVLVAFADPVGRRLLGLARADEGDHRAPRARLHALSVAFVVPGGGAARLGLPDVLFFARLPRRERALRAAPVLDAGS